MMELTVSRGADWECTVTARSKSSGQLSATGFSTRFRIRIKGINVFFRCNTDIPEDILKDLPDVLLEQI